MQIPIVKSPLSIIALFVSLIELFLAYPVTQLQGSERLIMVIFMTSFPFFVAALFFVMLWSRPVHLYNPQEIPHELQDRYQSKVVESTALELRLEEAQSELHELRQEVISSKAVVLHPDYSAQVSDSMSNARERVAESEVEALKAKVQTLIQKVDTKDESAFEQVRNEIKKERQESRKLKARRTSQEMSRFRDWLATRGFGNLPELPRIVIEPPETLNAYYIPTDKTAHLGSLMIDDPDTIAHTYFHVVLEHLHHMWGEESVALIEGLCDYYAGSYTGDPRLAKKFAEATGLKSGWIRNLDDVVKLTDFEKEPHAVSVVWSGACWELGKQFGRDNIDTGVRLTLEKLKPSPTIPQAARALRDQLGEMLGGRTREEVRKVFAKRAVEIPA